MRVNLNTFKTPHFSGNFYVATDVHGRLLHQAGILSEVEKREKNSSKKSTYIDGGDYFFPFFSMKAIQDVYSIFAKDNPNIRMILNLGNVELDNFPSHKKLFKDLFQKMKDSNIEVISTEKTPDMEYVKPYTVIEDEVEGGEKERVLVIGTATKTGFDDNLQIEKLRSTLKRANEEEKPDKVLLISHNSPEITKKLVDTLRDEDGIKNLEFVLGAHSHSLEDDVSKDRRARILTPPAQGKGAYVIENTKRGFLCPNPEIGADRWDYSSLSEGDRIILNNQKPLLEPDRKYTDILDTDSENLLQRVCLSTQDLGYRKMDQALNEPCEIGTLIANAMRDKTGADFAMLLTMDLRSKLPPAGDDITLYDVRETLNINKRIFNVQLSASDLYEIFNSALKKQKDPTNNVFMEYSDNLKIERYVDDRENKVKGIYILNKDNEWEEIKPDSTRKFTLATCSYIVNGNGSNKRRPGLEMFAAFDSEPTEFLTEDVFIEALKSLERNPVKIEKSQMVDVSQSPLN
jgi:hypothetical protein